MRENLRADVAILGSGISGFSVAETLVALGKSVVMLSPAHSVAGTATALSSGIWDTGPVGLADAKGQLSFRNFVRSSAWSGPLDELLLPTSLTQDGALAFDRFHHDSSLFDSLYQGSEERPALIPLEGGRFRATYAAQKLAYKADAMTWAGKTIAVAVCPQWRLPTEMWIAEWKLQLQTLGLSGDMVPFKISLKGFDWPLSQLAARLDADPNVAQLFQEQIRAGLKDIEPDLLLFPPLFISSQLVTRLERELGKQIAEFVSLSEPTAGHRLVLEMQRKREAMGIERVPLSSSKQSSMRQNTFLVTSANGEMLEVKTRAMVLCTGKYLSGGIESGERFTESVLGLPLFCNNKSGPIAFRDQLPKLDDFFRLGLWLDDSHRPRSLDGVVAENLFASGSVVGGLDFSRGGYGLGFFAWLGRACGKKIHEWLG